MQQGHGGKVYKKQLEENWRKTCEQQVLGSAGEDGDVSRTLAWHGNNV